MASTFDEEKFLFYTEIRKDELVKKLGAEIEIRTLMDMINMYVNNANIADHSFLKSEKTRLEELSTNLILNPKTCLDDNLNNKLTELADSIKLLEIRMKPTTLNFKDIQTIAYTVGTYQDKRSFLKHTFTIENPLNPFVKEHADYYGAIKNNDSIGFRYFFKYFDNEITNPLIAAVDMGTQDELSKDTIKAMFNNSFDYINRQLALLQLADKRDKIHKYYADERKSRRSRGFEEYIKLLYAPNWNEKELSKEQTYMIAECFQKQAEINGMIFKALYTTCLNLGGRSNSAGLAEELHNNIMNTYIHEGFSKFTGSCDISDEKRVGVLYINGSL